MLLRILLASPWPAILFAVVLGIMLLREVRRGGIAWGEGIAIAVILFVGLGWFTHLMANRW